MLCVPGCAWQRTAAWLRAQARAPHWQQQALKVLAGAHRCRGSRAWCFAGIVAVGTSLSAPTAPGLPHCNLPPLALPADRRCSAFCAAMGCLMPAHCDKALLCCGSSDSPGDCCCKPPNIQARTSTMTRDEEDATSHARLAAPGRQLSAQQLPVCQVNDGVCVTLSNRPETPAESMCNLWQLRLWARTSSATLARSRIREKCCVRAHSIEHVALPNWSI